MKTFTQADGTAIMTDGAKMLKKPNPVYLQKQEEEFAVQTSAGELKGNAGDFVAHDPISGDVWLVPTSYVEQHYVPFGGNAAA